MAASIPYARILSYTYDDTLSQEEIETLCSLHRHAENVLDFLQKARRGKESRPFFFCGNDSGAQITTEV
jgi:hypothetical protein